MSDATLEKEQGADLVGRKVWTCHIWHRHGEGTDVYATEARARKAAADFAREWWDEVAEDGEEAPEDDEELMQVYFERAEDEGCTIEEATIG